MRISKAIVMVALAVVAGMATLAVAQEAPKLTMAVIDVQQLVQDSAAGKEAMNRLRALEGEKQVQGKKIADEGAALATQLQTQGATLTDAKRIELQKQIEDKDIEFRHFKEDATQQLEEAKKKELQKLEQQIMPIIVEVGKEMKLEFIFNKFQSGLVYADDKLDITDLVLRRFNTKVTK